MRTTHGATKLVGIERDAFCERLSAGQGFRVAPRDLLQAARTVNQVPIPGRAFPLAERATACGAQQRSVDIGQGQIKRRRMRCLPNSPCATRLRYGGFAPKHHDLTRFANEFRRAWEIPHRDLALGGDIGKRRPVMSSPAPLRPGAIQKVGVRHGYVTAIALSDLRTLLRQRLWSPGLLRVPHGPMCRT